ncbi:hypothetical protein V8C42DRAFT_307445 [Trichoderma barbatum]
MCRVNILVWILQGRCGAQHQLLRSFLVLQPHRDAIILNRLTQYYPRGRQEASQASDCMPHLIAHMQCFGPSISGGCAVLGRHPDDQIVVPLAFQLLRVGGDLEVILMLVAVLVQFMVQCLGTIKACRMHDGRMDGKALV